MKRFSIKARVTAWFALAMFLVATCVFFVMTLHRSSQIKHNIERTLCTTVEEFAGFTVRNNGVTPPNDKTGQKAKGASDNERPEMPMGKQPPRQGGPKTYMGGVHIAVYNENGEEQTGRIPFELSSIDFVDGKIRVLSVSGVKYLNFDRKILLNDNRVLWVKGVSDLSNAQNAVNSTMASDYLLICVLIAIAAVGGYFIVGSALMPITKMRKTAQAIADSNDLSRRINLGEGKDEVYQLASVFDEMLGKIQHAFESEKQFTSDASHELRTPVAVILSECEYAEECAKTEEEFRESLSVVKRQGNKMAKLIKELLAISRMDKETFVPELEKMNLSELLETVCDEQTEIREKTITLTKEITPNIYALADSSLMMRLFINLISNAYQYGKENGHITVSLYEEKNGVVFKVADDGVGISTEDLPNIWERFYRGDKARTGTDGSMGLGLSMVKQITRLHNGTISVESTEGEGTVFTLILPKNKA
ncbi:MAG: HAMP domain-containing histidine kinase [Clostridia bacterium]|nr:HAMP domain-containing histidine kinase [Clostridia bacterium]